MSGYVVRIAHDQDTESPAEFDSQWRVYSFGRRHVNYRHPGDFFDGNGCPKLWLRNKLRTGLAHVLSYFEHGVGIWSLRGTGPQCRWDSVDVAGVAVWEHPPSYLGGKTPDERAADCAAFLGEYNDWCNGHCYYYTIDKTDSCPTCAAEVRVELVDSCGGFIGEKAVAGAIRESMPEDATPENTEVRGDAAWIAEYHNIYKA